MQYALYTVEYQYWFNLILLPTIDMSVYFIESIKGSASFGPRTPLVQMGPKESKDQMSQKTKGVRGPNEDRDQTNIWTKWNSESKSVWDQRKKVYQMMIKDQRSKMGPMCPGTKRILGPKESNWSRVSRDQMKPKLKPNGPWSKGLWGPNASGAKGMLFLFYFLLCCNKLTQIFE